MKPMNANELLAGLALARPVPITAVVTDSRKVQPGCIFVCFPGERVDGHDFAAGAYRDGAAGRWSRAFSLPPLKASVWTATTMPPRRTRPGPSM